MMVATPNDIDLNVMMRMHCIDELSSNRVSTDLSIQQILPLAFYMHIYL